MKRIVLALGLLLSTTQLFAVEFNFDIGASSAAYRLVKGLRINVSGNRPRYQKAYNFTVLFQTANGSEYTIRVTNAQLGALVASSLIEWSKKPYDLSLECNYKTETVPAGQIFDVTDVTWNSTFVPAQSAPAGKCILIGLTSSIE